MNGDADHEVDPHKEIIEEAVAELHREKAEKEARRPKNIGEGAVRLVSDSLGGVAMGAAAIVVGPIAGYKESGATGVLKGAVGGLAIGVASAAFGIGSGVAKFVDGASAHAEPKHKRQIEYVPVTEDADADQQAYENERNALYEGLLANVEENQDLGAPKETKLYDELGVKPEATPAEIRRAYFRLAQRYHPDKNQDDPQATEKFQIIADAYQILSDPVKREEYHRMGRADSEGLMDPKSLFALMFGNDKFGHIVGDLATSTLLSSTAEPAADGTPEEAFERMKKAAQRRKEFQFAREKKLAELLCKRLEMYIAGDLEKFRDHAKLELVVLRSEPFGRDMLHTCGYVYHRQAALILGKGKGPLGLHGFFSELSDKAQMFRSKARAIEGTLKVAQNARGPGENQSSDDAARREAVSVLGAVWLASVVDIQTTLRHVVKMVLTDQTVGKEVLKKRAEGVSELGKIFQQA